MAEGTAAAAGGSGGDDRLYFRQLLSGRDFAHGDVMARQMVNFVYLIGDRETGEAVAVDPAYAVQDLLDVLAADGMRLTGVLGTHFHPDHLGGQMGGWSLEGISTLLQKVQVPIHVQADEVLYYVRGRFGSRRGVEESSFTLHPRGIPHGPHPGTIVASREVKRTDELAVMVDTVRPLLLTRQALEMDDPNYPYSWLE